MKLKEQGTAKLSDPEKQNRVRSCNDTFFKQQASIDKKCVIAIPDPKALFYYFTFK